MVVIGAKGFAKEVFEVLNSKKYTHFKNQLAFFDNVSSDLPEQYYGMYRIIRTYDDLREYFKNNSNSFCFGIGNPHLRKKLADEFFIHGGKLESVISENASIGTYTTIGKGATIIGNAQITNGVEIGIGSLIYMNTSVTHDVSVGDYVEISPGVTITGNCSIGDFTSLGAGSVILPKIRIGKHCIVGAGAVVTKDIPDYSVVVGIPGKIIKEVNRVE